MDVFMLVVTIIACIFCIVINIYILAIYSHK